MIRKIIINSYMFYSVIYKNKYCSCNYIMQTNPKYLVNIDSNIDVLNMYVLVKKQCFGK